MNTNSYKQNAINRITDEEQIFDLADFFKLFADSTRLKILTSLIGAEFCVSDLTEILNMNSSAISHQLKILRSSRVVKCRRNGKQVFYSLDDDHVKEIIEVGISHLRE